MRHIKQSELLGSITEDWKTSANAKLTELGAKTAAERSAFINANYQVWSDLKARMAALSHDKCWYSEKRIALSEFEVDHFRPKSRVSGAATPHSGYWWLAFDWTNFRLAYSLINKRRTDSREGVVQGKGCYFPLVDEGARVPDLQPASTTGEQPTLIDPCRPADILLLDYAVEDGLVVERYKVGENAVGHERAKVSIDLFHLNEGTLIRDRFNLFVAIRHWVRQIEELEQERAQTGTLNPKQAYDYYELINRVAEHINGAAPFSRFARACLRQNGDLGWNTELLMAA